MDEVLHYKYEGLSGSGFTAGWSGIARQIETLARVDRAWAEAVAVTLNKLRNAGLMDRSTTLTVPERIWRRMFLDMGFEDEAEERYDNKWPDLKQTTLAQLLVTTASGWKAKQPNRCVRISSVSSDLKKRKPVSWETSKTYTPKQRAMASMLRRCARSSPSERRIMLSGRKKRAF